MPVIIKEGPNRLYGWPFIVHIIAGIFITVHFQSLMHPESVIPTNTFYHKYGFIPSSPSLYSMISAVFVPAGWLHLIGTSMLLVTFGDNIEDLFGLFGFILFFLGATLFSLFLHMCFNYDSNDPFVGASPVLSAIFAAYWLLFRNVRGEVKVQQGTAKLPMYQALLIWYIFSTYMSVLMNEQPPITDSLPAHIGGVVFGLSVAWGAKRIGVLDRHYKRFSARLVRPGFRVCPACYHETYVPKAGATKCQICDQYIQITGSGAQVSRIVR